MGNFKFRKAWLFPKSVVEWMQSRINGFTVHVCSGESELGDLKIDLYTDKADIKADMRHLPLQDGIADTVICDPPWSIQYPHKADLVYELRRILKVGGLLLFNGPWIPNAPGFQLEEIWVRDDPRPWYNTTLLVAMRRVVYEQSNKGRGKRR